MKKKAGSIIFYLMDIGPMVILIALRKSKHIKQFSLKSRIKIFNAAKNNIKLKILRKDKK